MSYYNRFGGVTCQQNPTTASCVCNTVKNIVKAQDKVADEDCLTSCDHAIQQLRRQEEESHVRYTTIPFTLYCKGTCKPFIGSGIFKNPASTHQSSFFGCVETPVFRAIHFIKNSNCCVKLELLVPASDDCDIPEYYTDKSNSTYSFFPEDNPVTGFFATGICLTVDLKQFMGITCLDPINPI